MSELRLVVIYKSSTSEAKRWKTATDIAMTGICVAKSEMILSSASYGQVFILNPCLGGCDALDKVNQLMANLYLQNTTLMYGVFLLQDCWRYGTGIYYKHKNANKPIENVFWSATYPWSDQFVSNIPDVDQFGYMLNPLIRMNVIDYSAVGNCFRGKCS